MATDAQLTAAEPQPLPELAAVHWRPRVDARALDRGDRLWTLTTVAHVVPFALAAAVLLALEPLTLPVALVCLAHAWIIPALYAQRGANVVRPRPRGPAGPERVSVGLLGDLVGHEARDLHARTGLVCERGGLGVWLLGEAGALLVRPGRGRARRVECYCVGVRDADLPSGDRIAHLLLALRADECGFATVANLAFSGRPRRVRARLRREQRPALDHAVAVAASSRDR
ncbi:hypothetical protein [Capillimicrobium parvum]|uniref:Uncharacterized protein n=1 Tax=Capillimicrobium parvum TaxID=2884022 RepID=A0A9E6XXL4_9ACTN|nr:hypothetical protein [Capillimicrobium parvum]UGS36243.1 hypothetical protein DSM104329_02644 [Capillimicrobium parvum]